MNTRTDLTLKKLRDACQRAKADVIAAMDYPCNLHVYTHRRAHAPRSNGQRAVVAHVCSESCTGCA